jgi:HK97 gp10 family phage protein
VAVVKLDKAAMLALARSHEVTEAVYKFGEAVADAAREAAPKNTGAGAASIRAELIQTYEGVYVARVGWDRDHFYMMFHELGTSRMSARPFLRPALDRRYDF